MVNTKPPTMKDVAKLAGVSIQTVSCVVNDQGSISQETRNRVLQAIEELNYRRDPIARSMRTRQTRLIALLVLDITNPVLSIIASQVEAAAYAENYSVLLYNVGQDARREQTYLDTAAERLVDGMIIVNAVDREHTFARLEDSSIPTVLIDCLATSEIPSVAVDNFQGAYIATQHAIELGHERIAHIAGALSLEVARQRADGYAQCIEDHNLHYQHIITAYNDRWDYHSGYRAMRQLIESDVPPTAVFAAGDQMAIGAYRALSEAGLRIPQDISVVGFDDIEAASFTTPPLTTIRQPFGDMARRAFALLLDLLDGRTPQETRVTLPAELIVRESTGRPE
jgi:DNA-binding LacI/PurR family transcriptional regulator